MKDFFLSHEDCILHPLVSPSDDNVMAWMEEQIERLCVDDVLYVGGKYYCHINLADFLCDMNSQYTINLSLLIDKYQKELRLVALQQVENLTNIIKFNNK